MIGIATLGIGSANYAARKPLMRLADFDGKKLRINGTALERAKMSALGATGIAMPLSEVMPALSQGTIDGTISGTSVFVSLKMNELVKTITVTNDTMLVSLAVVSQVWLDKLPPDLQEDRRRHRANGAAGSPEMAGRVHQAARRRLGEARRHGAQAVGGGSMPR